MTLIRVSPIVLPVSVELHLGLGSGTVLIMLTCSPCMNCKVFVVIQQLQPLVKNSEKYFKHTLASPKFRDQIENFFDFKHKLIRPVS